MKNIWDKHKIKIIVVASTLIVVVSSLIYLLNSNPINLESVIWKQHELQTSLTNNPTHKEFEKKYDSSINNVDNLKRLSKNLLFEIKKDNKLIDERLTDLKNNLKEDQEQISKGEDPFKLIGDEIKSTQKNIDFLELAKNKNNIELSSQIQKFLKTQKVTDFPKDIKLNVTENNVKMYELIDDNYTNENSGSSYDTYKVIQANESGVDNVNFKVGDNLDLFSTNTDKKISKLNESFSRITNVQNSFANALSGTQLPSLSDVKTKAEFIKYINLDSYKNALKIEQEKFSNDELRNIQNTLEDNYKKQIEFEKNELSKHKNDKFKIFSLKIIHNNNLD